MAIRIVDQTVPKPNRAAARARQAQKPEDAIPKKGMKPKPAAKLRIETAPSLETKRSRGRPSSGMRVVTLRLDPDVIDLLQKDGSGWGARANAVLRKGLGL